jgi:hypothetical protein
MQNQNIADVRALKIVDSGGIAPTLSYVGTDR